MGAGRNFTLWTRHLERRLRDCAEERGVGKVGICCICCDVMRYVTIKTKYQYIVVCIASQHIFPIGALWLIGIVTYYMVSRCLF